MVPSSQPLWKEFMKNLVNVGALIATIPMLLGFSTGASAEPSAPVAKLSQIEGQVMVNMGTTYVIASPGMEVQVGAKLVTAKGSSVTVTYSDGCIKRVKENTMVTVSSLTECTAGLINERVYVAEPQSTHFLRTEMAIALWGGAIGGVALYNPNNDNKQKNVSAE